MKKEPIRTESPKGYAVLSVLLAALCAVSAAYAAVLSADGGITSDAVFCIAISAVCILALVTLLFYVVRYRKTLKLANEPVYYTMVSGPNEEKTKGPFRIKGKMPPKDV